MSTYNIPVSHVELNISERFSACLLLIKQEKHECPTATKTKLDIFSIKVMVKVIRPLTGIV